MFTGIQFKQQQVINQFTNCDCNKKDQEIEYLKKQVAELYHIAIVVFLLKMIQKLMNLNISTSETTILSVK